MTHRRIEEIISAEEPTDEQLKLVDDLIKSKSVLKNLLKSIKAERTTTIKQCLSEAEN